MIDRAPPSRPPRPMRQHRPRRWGLPWAVVLATVVLVTGGVIAAVALGGGEGADSSEEPPFKPELGTAGPWLPSNPESAHHHLVANVRRSRLLYDRAGGSPIIRIAAKTEWGTPRVLSVVKRRGSWVAVLVPELKNGKVGWMRMRDVNSFDTVAWSLHADVSKRQILVRREGKVVRRLRVGVGRAGHSTPRGRFAVTDRLKVEDPSSPYGCCVLALTGHQTRLPPGWPGGDRLAVHATSDLSNLGRAVSLGCMRSRPEDVGWLIKRVPVGSPVFIHA